LKNNFEFRKNDFILIVVIFVVLLMVAAVFYNNMDFGSTVTVTVDGEIFGEYSLNSNQEIEITNSDGEVTNILLISDGTAKMTEATCPDLICVNTEAISKKGETIVCLPNKVVVTVESNEESDIDAVG